MQPFGIWRSKWANWLKKKPNGPLELSGLTRKRTRRKNAKQCQPEARKEHRKRVRQKKRTSSRKGGQRRKKKKKR